MPPILALAFALLHPGLQPLAPDELTPSDGKMREARRVRHLAVDDVADVRLGAAENQCDIGEGEGRTFVFSFSLKSLGIVHGR